MLIGFNKTLQVWKYEDSEKKRFKQPSIKGIFLNSRGSEKLPLHLVEKSEKEKDEPIIMTSYYNGVKNYTWF